MSLRINKRIGYFIKKEKFKDLFNKNIFEVAKQRVNFNDFSCYLKEKENLPDFDLFMIKQFFSENKTLILNNEIIIAEIFNLIEFNSVSGLFFQNAELYNKNRYNDYIDYYDEIYIKKNKKNKNKIYFVDQPLFPHNFWIDNQTGKMIKFNLNDNQIKLLYQKEKIISIGLPLELYFLLKYMKVMKNDISYKTLCMNINTVIYINFI